MNAPLRDVIADTLIDEARHDDRIRVIDCDVGRHTKVEAFRSVFPNRYYELGICEQNAVGFAAGMARCGRVPVVSAFAAFLVTKAWEQVRHSVIYNQSPVKLLATHAGISAGEDGATHQCLQDVCLALSLPDMAVLWPAFPDECAAMTRYAVQSTASCYMRVGRNALEDRCDLPTDFRIGDPLLLNDVRSDVVIVSTGEVTHEALEAVELLSQRGTPVRLIHVGSLRPLHCQALSEMVGRASHILALEEHGRFGGLSSLLADVHRDAFDPETRIVPVCVENSFGQTGTTRELRVLFGIDVQGIADKVMGCLGQ